MTKTGKPAAYSAAITAATISRRLRKAGFTMADTRGRWTEGIYVHRLGVSNLVTVDYHLPGHLHTAEQKTFCRAERDRALARLVEWGYTLDARWVKCERE